MTLRDIKVEVATGDGQRPHDGVGVGGQARSLDFVPFEPPRPDVGELSHDAFDF